MSFRKAGIMFSSLTNVYSLPSAVLGMQETQILIDFLIETRNEQILDKAHVFLKRTMIFQNGPLKLYLALSTIPHLPPKEALTWTFIHSIN